MWRRIHTVAESRAEQIDIYLKALREGSFERPADPGPGLRSGRAAVARRADLAAAPKAKRGKLNIRRSANDKFAEIRQLPLHNIVLTDGPSKLWFDYIKSHIEWPEIVQVYDLLSRHLKS